MGPCDITGLGQSILINSGVEAEDKFHYGLQFINNTFLLGAWKDQRKKKEKKTKQGKRRAERKVTAHNGASSLVIL